MLRLVCLSTLNLIVFIHLKNQTVMNLKYFMSMVALIVATQNSWAQLIVSGNVKDNLNQENLVGASVYISELKMGVTTDDKGNYTFSPINKGIYHLEISLVGYKSKIERIVINQDTTINTELNMSVAELNEVVVTAVTRATELKRSPIIIKTLDKNALNQNTATNLIDGLKNVAGINQLTTGAAISKPIIRGLGYNRVITLYNGIRQEGQQWGDEHGVEIDEFAVDKIEIVKGPGSLMYGSDGIAGVINFISPKAPNLGEINTQFLSSYQSNNNAIGYSLSNAGNKNGFQWLGRFSQKLAGNYQNSYDGKVYNSGYKEYDGNLFLGVNKKWGHSHWQINSFNNTLNLVEGERDSTGKFMFLTPDGNEKTANSDDLSGYKTGFPHQKVNHLSVSSNNYFILNQATINVDLGFQNNQRREFGDVTNPNDVALFFDLNTFNYNMRYNFAAQNGWETSVGLGGMYQNNTNRGLEFLIPDYHLLDVGAFLFTQKTFNEKLILAGGLRFDNRKMNSKALMLDSLGVPTTSTNIITEMKFDPVNQNYNGLSGSLGLSYLIDKTSTLKFNVSQGFRAPNISELASNGRHEGTFRYEIGTPTLKSETSHQIDLAYFKNAEHLTFEFTPFVNFISNYIFTEKLTDVNGNEIIKDPSDPAPAYQFTQGNAKLLGGEIYTDFHPHPLDWLHIENSFAFVKATQSNQSDSTRNLPFIPAPKYRGELKAEFKKWGKNISNGYVKFAIDHFFKQNNFYSAYNTETATPAYTLLSVGVGANIKAFGKKDFLNLFLNAENLADVSYQSHLSRLKYAPENAATGRSGVFNMGRNVSLKLIMNL
jgi:iron complex outermembrane recepter protein